MQLQFAPQTHLQMKAKLWKLHLTLADTWTSIGIFEFKLLWNYQNTSESFPYFNKQFSSTAVRAKTKT
jgi:hypothetical protein